MTPETLESSISIQIYQQKQNHIALYNPENRRTFQLSQDLYQRVISLAEISHWKPNMPFPSPYRWPIFPASQFIYPHWPLTEAEKSHQRRISKSNLAPRHYYTGDGRIMLKPAARSLSQTLRRELPKLPRQDPNDCHVAIVWGFAKDEPIVMFYYPENGSQVNPPSEDIFFCMILDDERETVRKLIDFLDTVNLTAVYDLSVFEKSKLEQR